MWNSAEAIAQTFVRAINRQDVDAMVALMAPGHRFVDSMGQAVEGRENVKACWVGYFRMVPDYSIVLEEAVCAKRTVLMVGTAQGTYTTDGWLKEENGWKTPAAFRALIKDGKVAEWRVYADNEPMRQRMKTAGKT